MLIRDQVDQGMVEHRARVARREANRSPAAAKPADSHATGALTGPVRIAKPSRAPLRTFYECLEDGA